MKKHLLNLAKLALGVGVVVWLAFTGRLDLSLMLSPQGGAWIWLVLSFVSLLALQAVAAMRWWVLSRVAGEERAFGSCMALTLIGSFFSTFLLGFMGGDLARTWYAVKGRKGKRVEGVTVIIFDRFLGLCALFLLSTVGLIWLWDQPFAPPLFGLLVLALVGCLVICLFADRLLELRWVAKVVGWVLKPETTGRIAQAMRLYRRHWPATLAMLGVGLAAHLVQAVAVYFAGRYLGDETGVAAYLVFVPLVILAGSVPITPAGLGVAEGLGGFMWSAMGSAAGANIIFMFRVARTAVGLLAGLPIYLIWKETHRPPPEVKS
jgi:glycosyltransferase 2 family protein